jgi:hypothetical protein
VLGLDEKNRYPDDRAAAVMILDDEDLRSVSQEAAELGAFVHVEDVASAVRVALRVDVQGHHRLTLCGPGPFDTSAANALLGWKACRGWPQPDRN